MNPHDNPNLTAYILGELDGPQAHEVRAQFQHDSPSAHEMEQIEAVTDALRHTAPIPSSRLTLEQRHAVLHPAHLPRMVQPMMPRRATTPASSSKQPGVLWTVLGGMMKAAAVLTLTGAAFFLGKNMPDAAPQAAAHPSAPVETAPQAENTPKLVQTPKPLPTPILAPAANPAPKPVLVAETAPKAPPAAQSPTKPIIAAKPEITQPAPQAPTVPELGFSTPAGASSTFASTTKQPAGQFSLRPALIKAPSPPRDPTALAAPLLTDAKTAPTVTKSPELLIHSWKSEIATCPWNPDHRLLRIVIQLPSNQSAVTTAKNASYPVSISFDPLSVKQYRLLSERHLPAADLSSAGTQIIWYEFQPNSKSDINSKTGRQIASVSVFGARFTTQAVGPFDSSRLQVLDRGYTLENARDDFVFESAVIGFGLLMRGAEQVGHLDHDLVLDLARRAKNSATSDERTRFIRLLEDSRRAIGLGL